MFFYAKFTGVREKNIYYIDECVVWEILHCKWRNSNKVFEYISDIYCSDEFKMHVTRFFFFALYSLLNNTFMIS